MRRLGRPGKHAAALGRFSGEEKTSGNEHELEVAGASVMIGGLADD